jgi:hypothetical protein
MCFELLFIFEHILWDVYDLVMQGPSINSSICVVDSRIDNKIPSSKSVEATNQPTSTKLGNAQERKEKRTCLVVGCTKVKAVLAVN